MGVAGGDPDGDAMFVVFVYVISEMLMMIQSESGGVCICVVSPSLVACPHPDRRPLSYYLSCLEQGSGNKEGALEQPQHLFKPERSRDKNPRTRTQRKQKHSQPLSRVKIGQ